MNESPEIVAQNRTMEILNEKMKELAEAIRANHEAAGQVASGRMRDSLQSVTLHDNRIFIGFVDALNYVEALERGNAPWEDIPIREAKDGHYYAYVPGWFAETIGQWMHDKGIEETKERNRWSVAWNIIHFGTKLFQDGGRTDIYSDLVDQYSDEIANEIMKEYDTIINTITLNNK